MAAAMEGQAGLVLEKAGRLDCRGWLLPLFVLAFWGSNVQQCLGDQTEEYLKREFSLIKPYQGLGSTGSHWDLLGSTMVTTQYVRLTPDMQSKQGAIWSRLPCYLRDWELQVHFKVHGQGKKNLNGDGFAIWFTKDKMQQGPVFGSKDKFVGLAVFVDTYPNEEKQHERTFPFISAMVSNGSLNYEHERDGKTTELGGCTALVRNLNHDTFLVIRYVKRRLTVMIDIDGKHEWRDCLDIPGVRLPRGYYFGTSAATGDLSDNHDIISLKLYELTVERTPQEESLDKEVFIPSVDNMKLGTDDLYSEPMSGITVFFIIFFGLLGLMVVAVVGVIAYNKWQEQSRKHFY
ncbi:VIP36-like protein [Latimeria chalumnae]|uniref:VIP36-like protein n=1 Tax=Latimeria chalumnae TaxID=7897 RepID=UPI0006D92DFE|nr:PREDICTED: VIP36-like protein [Latimeria chalumnae]|eukprot:XP_014343443.1 PREDICTED: VIP36-like protein [Latimeria chalumnae]